MTQTSVTATDLPRILQCPGSRLMSRAIPDDQSSQARDEGNCADWLAVELFEGRSVTVGARAPNGWVVTDEMLDHVNQYLGALDCGAVQVNTSFEGAGWDVRGRADHIGRRDGSLVVDDLKYGHRLVSPERNWTLLSHAIGTCIRDQIRPDLITLRIHQPRAYHPDGPLRSWSCSYDELMGYYQQIKAALSNPSDQLRTDLATCATCHALPICPAARAAGMNALDACVEHAFDDSMPADRLVHEMHLFERAEGWIKALREARTDLVTHRIQAGQNVSDGEWRYQLKPRLGQSAWNAGLTAAALSAATGVDLRRDATVTPAEAKRRGVPDAVVEALTNRPNIGVKLERVNVDAQARRSMGE